MEILMRKIVVLSCLLTVGLMLFLGGISIGEVGKSDNSGSGKTGGEQQQNPVVLILDASGSMWGQIGGKAKMGRFRIRKTGLTIFS